MKTAKMPAVLFPFVKSKDCCLKSWGRIWKAKRKWKIFSFPKTRSPRSLPVLSRRNLSRKNGTAVPTGLKPKLKPIPTMSSKPLIPCAKTGRRPKNWKKSERNRMISWRKMNACAKNWQSQRGNRKRKRRRHIRKPSKNSMPQNGMKKDMRHTLPIIIPMLLSHLARLLNWIHNLQIPILAGVLPIINLATTIRRLKISASPSSWTPKMQMLIITRGLPIIILANTMTR